MTDFFQRGFDTGNPGYVVWTTILPDPAPGGGTTIPPYVGPLIGYGIIQVSPPVALGYIQRAFDSGLQKYVQWQTLTPDPNPLPGTTTPHYTGILSGYGIVQVLRP